MALKIAVVKNHLPSCRSPFIVRSGPPADTVEFDQLVEIMANGRTTLTRTDILGAMQLYKEELQRLLAEGKTVKTPSGSFFLCAGGTMDSLDEAFLPGQQDSNHDVRLHHKPERIFEGAIVADVRIVREERPDLSVPSIRTVQATGVEDGASIQAGGMVQVKGLRLRFDSRETSQGVFFEDASGVETRSPFYAMILPGTVIATVPISLQPGTYALVLRAAVNGKDVKESRFDGVVIA
jgi:hypothetical protein